MGNFLASQPVSDPSRLYDVVTDVSGSALKLMWLKNLRTDTLQQIWIELQKIAGYRRTTCLSPGLSFYFLGSLPSPRSPKKHLCRQNAMSPEMEGLWAGSAESGYFQ